VLTRIDHLIVAAEDPAAAALEIEEGLGLAASGGGRHDAHGTHNRLIWLGDSYLELMGVFDERLATESWWGRHMMARLADGGGYAGIALATDDLEGDVAGLRALGSPISGPAAGERIRPDGDVVRWSIGRLPAADPELGLVFLIQHDLASAEWRPGDRAARAQQLHPLGGPASLARVELPVADVTRASTWLLRSLGLQFRPSLAGGGARDTSIGPQTLRLRRGGRPTVVVRGGNGAREHIATGCRWVVQPAQG
jgi:hypothetical protein